MSAGGAKQENFGMSLPYHAIKYLGKWRLDKIYDFLPSYCCCYLKDQLVKVTVAITETFFSFHFFILNFLYTVAPSTKSGCFSVGRGKNLITMLLK